MNDPFLQEHLDTRDKKDQRAERQRVDTGRLKAALLKSLAIDHPVQDLQSFVGFGRKQHFDHRKGLKCGQNVQKDHIKDLR